MDDDIGLFIAFCTQEDNVRIFSSKDKSLSNYSQEMIFVDAEPPMRNLYSSDYLMGGGICQGRWIPTFRLERA
jgi:hypothetical protein